MTALEGYREAGLQCWRSMGREAREEATSTRRVRLGRRFVFGYGEPFPLALSLFAFFNRNHSEHHVNRAHRREDSFPFPRVFCTCNAARCVDTAF